VLVGAVLLEKKEILVGVAGVWLAMLIASAQAATLHALRGAEVTPTQFPEIHRTLEELCRRFAVPPTRAFVIRDTHPRAHAFGFKAPYVIVLHSALLDSLDEDELRYVLGRQLGHIRFGHTRAAILLGGDETTLPALLSWAAWLRDLIFAWYRRTQVMGGDRAGILACGDVGLAMRVQAKLAVGNAQLNAIRPTDLVEQALTVKVGSSRLQAALIRLQSTSPLLIQRLEAMLEWAGLPGQSPGDKP
jgi:Zn-dependent protease with chaperone function